MSNFGTSDDPRFVAWSSVRHSDPINNNVTCYAYAVANDATLQEYAGRSRMKTWRPPQIGDGCGLNFAFYGLVRKPTAEDIVALAIKDGLKPLVMPPKGQPLPKPSPGHRLISIVCTGDNTAYFAYHTLREHEGTWTSKFGQGSIPSVYDLERKVITDPRTANFYSLQKGPYLFEVPEAGIDLRIKPEMGDLLDSILDQQAAMMRQKEKRRVSVVQPRLASSFRQLASMVSDKDPALAEQLKERAVIHQTGNVPAGHTRSKSFKNR